MKHNKNNYRFLTTNEVLANLSKCNKLDQFNSYSQFKQQQFMDFCTGKSFKILTYDSIFKKIFDTTEHKERLEHFISDILGFPVSVVKVLPVDSSRVIDAGSILIMDIVVQSEDGSIINVEMQKKAFSFTGKRDSCYIADLLMRQYNDLKAKSKLQGKKFTYKDLKPVYSIIILENSYYDLNNLKNCWEHTGKVTFDTGLKMDFLINIKYLVLDKYREIGQNITNNKEKWAYLLSAETPEEIGTAASLSDEMYEIVSDIASFVSDVGRVMDMFSDALKILDENTNKMIFDEMQDDIERLEEEYEKAKEKYTKAEEKCSKAEEKCSKAETDVSILRAILSGSSPEDVALKFNTTIDYVMNLTKG